LVEIINNESYNKVGLNPVTDMRTAIKDWIEIEKNRTKEKVFNCISNEQYNQKGIDQKFLRYVVYKMAWEHAYIHDSYPQYNCWSGRFDYQPHPEYKEQNTGFPTLRGGDWNNFVGQVYDENEIPNSEYADLIRQRDFMMYDDYTEDEEEKVFSAELDKVININRED